MFLLFNMDIYELLFLHEGNKYFLLYFNASDAGYLIHWPMCTCLINSLLQVVPKWRNSNSSYVPWFLYGDADLKVFNDLFWIYVDHVFIRASFSFQQFLIGQIENDFFLSTNVYINRETVSLSWSTILSLKLMFT